MANYYVTSDGNDLFDVLERALVRGVEKKAAVVIG
jgi:hypothetical protein